MDLYELAERVQSRQDLAEFIEALRRDLETNGDAWENPTLDRYLESLAMWITDMDGYFHNQGREVPSEPDWQLVAHMLDAAAIYE